MFYPEQKIGNYILVERLGQGGFGEVWMAERRTKFVTTKVAVKLPLDEQVEHEIIKQEAEIWERASGHQNVLPIIEADEYDGQIVIVSEFATDGSLEDLLRTKDNSLPLKLAVQMTIGILSGLDFLHSKNIIHRDIKPANILLQGETPRLTDFGISRVIKNDIVSKNNAGTPFYMAPEAFNRKRNVQTDIWSVGIMLYQMLTGRFPFPSNNISEMMAAIILHEPESLPTDIPSGLRQIVAKALKKIPTERYQTALEFRKDLQKNLNKYPAQSEYKTIKIAEELTIKYSTDSFDDKKKTIAILPFKNLSGNPASEFYEFSLADAVTTELARLQSLIVRPSSAIAKYQGKDIDPRQAGREMKVKSILSAGFIHSGDRIRVTAQLLDVLSGDIIWSDRIDSDASDIFALQDTITQRILDGLDFDLSAGEQENFGQRPTASNEAYEEYLLGRDKLVRFIYRTISLADYDAATKCFKKAIELDPNFALAWSGLGSCFANKVFKAMGDFEDILQARFALEQALRIDPNIIEARVMMYFIYLHHGEKKKARSEIIELYKQFPNDSKVYFSKGVLHRLDGEYDKSLESYNKLKRLDPSSSVVTFYSRARIYSLKGDFENALKEINKGTAIEPNHPFLRVFHAQVLFLQEKIDEAVNIMSKVLDENPYMEGIRPLLAVFLSAQNKPEEARKHLSKRALEMAHSDFDLAYWTAEAYALLQERDTAFEWLERAIELGLEDKNLFENDKSIANLREDKRFAELMQSISSNQ